MRTVLLLAPIALLSCVGCTAHPRAVHSPQLTGVIGKSEDITNTVSMAQSDNKEVKKSLGGIKDHTSEIKRLHLESMSSLDRLDYKATILLK